ncbi:hypothetical protein ACFPM0_27060 [Pseudonocardia sulfidoxydans]|uniref:hypothetical protein n=1 Tax=Pseudonocardia sulfidoxydans TaxID=54011 RepID=UPI0036215962
MAVLAVIAGSSPRPQARPRGYGFHLCRRPTDGKNSRSERLAPSPRGATRLSAPGFVGGARRRRRGR